MWWKQITAVAVVGLAALTTSFKNPIIPGFNPDPTIARAGKDYFLATSTFEYFPGAPIYHSTDLIDWKLIGHALNRPSQLNLQGTAPSGGMFAPTLRYHEKTKTFYLLTTVFHVINPPDNNTNVTPRSFYVKTKNIWDEKSWSDPVYFDMHGFDPDLFIDDDGKAYLTSTFGAGEFVKDPGYFSVFITQVDLKTGDSLTDAKLLHVSTLPLDTPRLAEASHIFKKDGYYYLLTAEGGTELGHRAMIKRAKSLDGPWEENPSNPILRNGRDPSAPIQATGHADFVQTPKGDWYTVFLAIRPQAPANATGIPQLGRETFLAPMTWEKGAWPVINGGKVVGLDVPGVLYDLKKPKVWRDEFDGKLKDKAYYTPRTPYKQAVFLNERKGYARIKGNVYTLAQRETPACLFRKQTELETVFSTELEFSPKTKKHEAGATIFLSLHYHNNIAITINPETNKPSIVARTRSGKNAGLKETWEDLPSDYSGPVRLFIKAEREKYSLGYSLLTKAGGGKKGKEEWSKTKYLAEVESKWLQAWLEGWQNFVGSFFGIYATGNGLPIREPADFKYIQTESQE